jgi:hypothetical protein
MTNAKFGEKSHYKHDIVSYKNFISEEECKKIVSYFEDPSHPWSMSAFFESYGMSILPEDPNLEKYGLDRFYLKNLTEKMQKAVEDAHQRPVKSVSSHAQKWEKGAFAPFHSDNTDMEGNWSAWERSKLVSLLYINSNYTGGELNYRDHDLTITPTVGELVTFPGGIANVHEVRPVLNGTRHTIGAFWDYAESEYSKERMNQWESEIELVRYQQKEQQEAWKTQLNTD